LRQALADYLNKNPTLSKCLLFLFGILTLLALEGALRLSNFGSRFDFILKDKNEGFISKHSLNTQYIALNYFSHLRVDFDKIFKDDPWFPDTEFAHQKKQKTFRIFLLGGSTTRGFPFTKRTISYSGFLQNILTDILPNHNIEIINAGYDALSSFAVLDIFKRVINQNPDLIIVYTGHNEFIGHFGTNSTVNLGKSRLLIKSIISLQNSKLFLLTKLAVFKIKSLLKKNNSEPVNLFRAMLKKSKVSWNEHDHELTETNYKLNLTEMATLAREKKVQIVFSSLASNFSDFEPLRSEISTPAQDNSKQKIKILLSQVKTQLKEKNFKKAILLNKRAIDIDSNYAKSHYQIGKVYIAASQFSKANTHFKLARDLDRIHLRSCSKLNSIIHKIGKEQKIPVIDMEESLKVHSKNGILGENFFLEHVHPNINGHLLMGETIARFLFRHDILGTKKQWDWTRVRSAKDYVIMSGFNRKQFENSRYTIGRLLLDFPFYQCKEGQKFLKQAQKFEFETELIHSCNKFHETQRS
jgi:tetratricopeptide (TPR) repeat protein